MKSRILGLLAVGLLAGPMAANANIVVTYFESGLDLVFQWSGSWNTGSIADDSTYTTDYIFSSGLQERFGGFTNGYGRIANALSAYTQTEGTGIFANDFGFINGVSYGDTFSLDWVNPTTVYLYGPSGYVAGQNLSGGMTIANKSIADVGLAAATFDFGQYGSVQFRPAQSVPEPSTLALLGLGLAGLGFSRKRKAN